ncbi:MAG: DUF4041 domain-containing protein, partial [Burkholderiales bacterium]|nr:DUF4041 domain-containing protein [Burkholderiales bacterium]
MSENILTGLLAFLTVAIPLIQHYRFKKKYTGFKNIQAAILEESKKLTLLKQEQEASIELLKDHETRALAAIKQKNEAESTLEKLQTIVTDLEKFKERIRSETIEVKNKISVQKINLIAHQKQNSDLSEVISQLNKDKIALEARIAHLLSLESREKTIETDIEALSVKLQREQRHLEYSQRNLNAELESTKFNLANARNDLAKIMGRIDLFSRVDEYTRVGHFEMPNYLYETSARYQSEIKDARDQQRKLIREKRAITYPDDLLLSTNKLLDRKILDGQIQLMLSAFNVECDLLIGKVNPANLDRTLEQIEKRAEALEKNCATLKCGFNIDYIELKFEECKFQFEYMLKSKEEQEEQRIIREQMKEEVRVQKQYEEAIKEAERDELRFTRLLEKAREHLTNESEQERSLSLAKIHLLEDQLKEAQERSTRAKSMAEQTRRGFVYVISNIGAFGEGVYKIGLTRRLDPQERVDELSSASVPFRFDVHAMYYSEDAPALEHALHK